MWLNPNASQDGAVDLYIPASRIPTGQAVDVFYVDESGTIDSYGLIVTEGAQAFLQSVATATDAQVKAAYADVTAVSSDTYLEDTAAAIRAAGVTPLPSVPSVVPGSLFAKSVGQNSCQMAVRMTDGTSRLYGNYSSNEYFDDDPGIVIFNFSPDPFVTDEEFRINAAPAIVQPDFGLEWKISDNSYLNLYVGDIKVSTLNGNLIVEGDESPILLNVED